MALSTRPPASLHQWWSHCVTLNRQTFHSPEWRGNSFIAVPSVCSSFTKRLNVAPSGVHPTADLSFLNICSLSEHNKTKYFVTFEQDTKVRHQGEDKRVKRYRAVRIFTISAAAASAHLHITGHLFCYATLVGFSGHRSRSPVTSRSTESQDSLLLLFFCTAIKSYIITSLSFFCCTVKGKKIGTDLCSWLGSLQVVMSCLYSVLS